MVSWFMVGAWEWKSSFVLFRRRPIRAEVRRRAEVAADVTRRYVTRPPPPPPPSQCVFCVRWRCVCRSQCRWRDSAMLEILFSFAWISYCACALAIFSVQCYLSAVDYYPERICTLLKMSWGTELWVSVFITSTLYLHKNHNIRKFNTDLFRISWNQNCNIGASIFLFYFL